MDAVQSALAVAQKGIQFSLPVPDGPTGSAEWIAPSGETALLSWTQEPADSTEPLLTRHGNRATGIDGYITSRQSRRSMAAADIVEQEMRATGGCFSVIRATEGGLEAATATSGTAPVYHCESARLRIVGTRGLLVHLIAQYDSGEELVPRFDIRGLRMVVNTGSTFDVETSYHGLKALPPGSIFRCDGHDARVNAWWSPTEEVRGRPRSSRRAVSSIADALVASVAPLASEATPVSLALSGGRDSRLLAATLHAAGVPFTTSTYGPSDHPDVVLAAQISERLGVPHSFTTPATDDDRTHVLIEDPLLRAIRIHDVSDGMVGVWDDVPDYGPMGTRIGLSGVGGEILRGGYNLPHLVEPSPDVAASTVRNLLVGQPALFHDEVNEYWEERAGPWIEAAARAPVETLEELFIRLRTARWGAVRRQGATMRYPLCVPFHDNIVVAEAMRAPAIYRWSERMVFDLISKLAPQLSDLPIEGQRWRFERDAPRRRREKRGWSQRRPLTADVHRTLAWNRLYDPGLRGLLRETIESGFGRPVMNELLRKETALAHFGDEPPRYPVIAWNLLGVAVLTTARWWETPRAARRLDHRVSMSERPNS